MAEVVTIGETMVLMVPMQAGPLRYVSGFSKTIGGAESNLCIAISRLGHSAGWISRLGRDEFGLYIHNFLRGEGVDVSQVRFDDEAPTAVFFKERREGAESRVYYYRKLSAASRLQPIDLNPEYIKNAKVLHVSGITPALSEDCRQTILKAIDIAKENGVTVSFDPNIRLKLWSIEQARPVLANLAERCDIFLPGEHELALIYPNMPTEQVVDQLLNKGVEKVVVKKGEKGCLIHTSAGVFEVPGFAVKMVEPVGAGDGFAAGYLAGQIRGWSDFDSGRLGNAVGAMAVTVTGDIEGYPSMQEAEDFICNKSIIER